MLREELDVFSLVDKRADYKRQAVAVVDGVPARIDKQIRHKVSAVVKEPVEVKINKQIAKK